MKTKRTPDGYKKKTLSDSFSGAISVFALNFLIHVDRRSIDEYR